MPFLVMDYLPGITLKEIAKPVSIEQAAQLLLPISQALAHAHLNGILHRDVKPSNILITSTGVPMLADFGIAKIMVVNEEDTLTGTGQGVGTPEYMAPEQALGEEVDSRADIYALGIVFYELITGRKPFTADTPMAVILKQIRDPFPPPSVFVPEIPASVEQVLSHVLEKRPEDRFQRIESFVTVLEQLATKQATTTSFLDKTINVTAVQNPSRLDYSEKPSLKDRSLSQGTRDELEPDISKLKPLSRKTRPFNFNTPFILGIGLTIVIFLTGLVLVFRALHSLTGDFYNKPLEVNVQEVKSEIGLKRETPGLETEMPINKQPEMPNTPEAAPKTILASNVIQLSNVSQLSEVAHLADVNTDLAAWLPDSQGFIVASTFYGGFTQYDVNLSSPINIQEGISYIYPAAICVKSKLLAMTDQGKEMQIWQFGANKPKFVFKGNKVSLISKPVFSPDCQTLAGIIDGALYFWDTNDGSLITKLDINYFTNEDTYVLAFSHDGTLFAAGNLETGEIILWDVQSRSLKQTFHWHEGVWALAFAPDNKTLASGSVSYGSQNIIRLWNIDDGKLILTIRENNAQVRDLEFSLDGQLLVSGMESGAVEVWRVIDGSFLTTLTVENRSVNVVNFSPDGTQLLITGINGIGVWRIKAP
jgi:serine/threonine protein kinase